MHIPATLEQARSTLAIMLGIAAAEGPPGDADKESIAAVTDYIFRIEEQFGLAGLTPLSPTRLATLAADPDVALQAASFAAVMALADGAVNVAKLSAAVRIADALGVRDGYVDELARLAIGDLREIKARLPLATAASVTGDRPSAIGSWLRPYDRQPDAALTTRFQALERLPFETFGRAFADFYAINRYPCPGEKGAVNFALAMPHNSVHVLAGYDTTPYGELQTAALTAAMHRSHAMAGHVLPAMLRWHFGIPLDTADETAKDTFDPHEFFYAWARGEDMIADLFAPDWNFWAAAIQPLDAVREAVGLVG